MVNSHCKKSIVQCRYSWIFLFLQSGGALYVICNYWADYCCLYYSFSFEEIKETADQAVNDAIVPGVMGQTGMETVEIVKGIVKETEPDL